MGKTPNAAIKTLGDRNSPYFFRLISCFHTPTAHTFFLNLTMKKTLLTLIVLCTAFYAFSQVCRRDSSLYTQDTSLISPRPTPPGGTQHTLWAACINQPYEQSITIKVPSTFTFNDIQIPVTNVSIATSGAITNLPAGITYTCDPPNCVFNANTLGCVLLSGTPNNPAQAPKTFEPIIKATIATTILPLNIDFPGPIAPGTYYLDLLAAGTCSSSASDFSSQINSIKNTPNPFGHQTLIEVRSATTGSFSFEVFNPVGQRIHQQAIILQEGNNQFTFDAGDLANGLYFYTISNAVGKVTRTMSIAR